MFYLMRSLIALHLSDSPTDLIPRPGAQKFKHPSAASAATPFALALPAASSKLLLATAPLSSALFGWHYYNALSFFVKHLFRVFSRTKSSFSKKTDRKKRSVAIFCILPQSAAAAIYYLSNQSSETLVFSRKIGNIMFVPYVFSLVFALMSRNKGNFLFRLPRPLYQAVLRKFVSLPF